MPSGHPNPNRPSKGGPDDDRRFHQSKRRFKTIDEGCSKTKNLASSYMTQPKKTLRQELDSRYGPVVNSQFRKLEKTLLRQVRHSNSLTFLMRCRDNNIIPKGLRLKAPTPTLRAKTVCENASKALVRDQICVHRKGKAEASSLARDIEGQIQSVVSKDDLQRITTACKASAAKANIKAKQTHLKKYKTLLDESTRKEPHKGPVNNNPRDKLSTVINISKKSLSAEEMSLLNKGLN